MNVFNAPVITTFPHIENFELNNGYWRSSGNNNSWEYGIPAADKINKAASGAKAWKTNLTGNYKDNETSYFYSPCFNISGMTNPTLSFNIALDLEDCGSTFAMEPMLNIPPMEDMVKAWVMWGQEQTGIINYSGPTIMEYSKLYQVACGHYCASNWIRALRLASFWNLILSQRRYGY